MQSDHWRLTWCFFFFLQIGHSLAPRNLCPWSSVRKGWIAISGLGWGSVSSGECKFIGVLFMSGIRIDYESDRQIWCSFHSIVDSVTVCYGEEEAELSGKVLCLCSYPPLWPHTLGSDRNNRIADIAGRVLGPHMRFQLTWVFSLISTYQNQNQDISKYIIYLGSTFS